jgi:hypothetical protein
MHYCTTSPAHSFCDLHYFGLTCTENSAANFFCNMTTISLFFFFLPPKVRILKQMRTFGIIKLICFYNQMAIEKYKFRICGNWEGEGY